MRGGLLLVLLIGIALTAYLWSQNASTVSQTNQAVRQQVAPITGRGPDDAPMDKSAEFAGERNGLTVKSVVAGGYFDQYFGLKAGDVIITAGDLSLRGMDEGLAVPQLFQMVQQKRSLEIMRAGQKMTLNPKS